VPRRRCVGCGRIGPKLELVRIAIAQDESPPARAVIDRPYTLPGRGAYLCRADHADRPRRDCARLAERNHGLRRTLRRAVTLDPEIVESAQ
jgi:predicted RNA-binding protein YlxR (DUF448 family)